ncbi:MAG TPA: MDR family MFS transporter [Thermomicrobiales bacterium]|nr:MDR family MFS transporter [Thermomicrobiales bacterium]
MNRLISNQKYVIAVVYVSTMLLNTLDATIVNVALATLSREFNVSPASIESVVIGYIVSLAVFMPASGWLGDRFGAKRIFLLALSLFTVASALCGVAQSLDQLVLFRVLQGAGGGLLTPVGMAMLYRAFPPEERVGVGRILMFATILGPALGPVIGGLILEYFSWRWCFYVNIPIGVAALVFGLLFLHDHRQEDVGSFDLPGFLLAGAGFGLTMFALSEGPQEGWLSPLIASCGVVGLVLLAIFVVVELRTRQPMVQLRLLSNRLFRAIIRVSIFGTAGFLGALFLLPLFLQEVRGESALTAGLTTMPEAIGVVLATQVVARIYPLIGPRRLMASGLVLVAISVALLGMVGRETPLWVVQVVMFFVGVGMAFVFLPNQAASMATISRTDTGGASMLFSVQRQLGSAMGVALLSTVLATIGVFRATADGGREPNLTAYHAAFFVAAGLSLIGAVMALFVPDEDAAATMRRRPVAEKREPVEAVA